MLSTKHRFLFIHIPKTAGNSIQRVLLPFSEDKMKLIGDHQDGIERFEIRSDELSIHKHSTLKEYKAQLEASRFSQLFKFCCVRNPWERCVSYFFSPSRGQFEWSASAFEEFINEKVAPSTEYVQLSDKDDDPFSNLDYVIRFENLSEDFKYICQQLALPATVLPAANVSKHGDYRTYYPSDDLILKVAEKFSAEIQEFGYSFE